MDAAPNSTKFILQPIARLWVGPNASFHSRTEESLTMSARNTTLATAVRGARPRLTAMGRTLGDGLTGVTAVKSALWKMQYK